MLGLAMTSRGPKGVYCGNEICGDVLGEGVEPLSVGVELLSVGVELEELEAFLFWSVTAGKKKQNLLYNTHHCVFIKHFQ